VNDIKRGQFIVQYFGQLVTQKEGDAREKSTPSCFRYFFHYRNTGYWFVFVQWLFL